MGADAPGRALGALTQAVDVRKGKSSLGGGLVEVKPPRRRKEPQRRDERAGRT
jgi:hypothetical protein